MADTGRTRRIQRHTRKGKAGLAGHLALKHGLRSKARFFVRSAACPACLKCFHTRKLDSQERNRCKKARKRSMADRSPVVQTDVSVPTTPVNEEGTVPTHFIEDFL